MMSLYGGKPSNVDGWESNRSMISYVEDNRLMNRS